MLEKFKRFTENKWGVVLLTILIPPVGAFFMWRHKHFTKNVRGVVYALSVICIVIALVVDKSNAPNNTQIPTATLPTAHPSPQVNNEAPIDDMSETAIRNLLKDVGGSRVIRASDKTIKKIEIKDHEGTSNPDDKFINIYLKPILSSDDTYFAKSFAETMVSYSEILFKNPKVQELSIWGVSDFTDANGKASEQNAVRLDWSRETYNKLDITNFKNMVVSDYSQAFLKSDNYYIHPSILKNLKNSNGLKSNGGK